ncbi:hypothetical protein HDV05_005405 [Chytridiales sp. JEL 0842]|nr:hypothetical protein HDV05_005405 [Chytridiales sp. JEL 0842]
MRHSHRRLSATTNSDLDLEIEDLDLDISSYRTPYTSKTLPGSNAHSRSLKGVKGKSYPGSGHATGGKHHSSSSTSHVSRFDISDAEELSAVSVSDIEVSDTSDSASSSFSSSSGSVSDSDSHSNSQSTRPKAQKKNSAQRPIQVDSDSGEGEESWLNMVGSDDEEEEEEEDEEDGIFESSRTSMKRPANGGKKQPRSVSSKTLPSSATTNPINSTLKSSKSISSKSNSVIASTAAVIKNTNSKSRNRSESVSDYGKPTTTTTGSSGKKGRGKSSESIASSTSTTKRKEKSQANSTSGKKSSVIDDDEDDEGEGSENSETLYCICRKPYDDEFMICCDLCEEWYHGDCVNVSSINPPAEYICPVCTAKAEKAASRTNSKAELKGKGGKSRKYTIQSSDSSDSDVNIEAENEDRILSRKQPMKQPRNVQKRPTSSRSVALSGDEDDELCPVCDGECTCNPPSKVASAQPVRSFGSSMLKRPQYSSSSKSFNSKMSATSSASTKQSAKASLSKPKLQSSMPINTALPFSKTTTHPTISNPSAHISALLTSSQPIPTTKSSIASKVEEDSARYVLCAAEVVLDEEGIPWRPIGRPRKDGTRCYIPINLKKSAPSPAAIANAPIMKLKSLKGMENVAKGSSYPVWIVNTDDMAGFMVDKPVSGFSEGSSTQKAKSSNISQVDDYRNSANVGNTVSHRGTTGTKTYKGSPAKNPPSSSNLKKKSATYNVSSDSDDSDYQFEHSKTFSSELSDIEDLDVDSSESDEVPPKFSTSKANNNIIKKKNAQPPRKGASKHQSQRDVEEYTDDDSLFDSDEDTYMASNLIGVTEYEIDEDSSDDDKPLSRARAGRLARDNFDDDAMVFDDNNESDSGSEMSIDDYTDSNSDSDGDDRVSKGVHGVSVVGHNKFVEQNAHEEMFLEMTPEDMEEIMGSGLGEFYIEGTHLDDGDETDIDLLFERTVFKAWSSSDEEEEEEEEEDDDEQEEEEDMQDGPAPPKEVTSKKVESTLEEVKVKVEAVPKAVNEEPKPEPIRAPSEPTSKPKIAASEKPNSDPVNINSNPSKHSINFDVKKTLVGPNGEITTTTKSVTFSVNPAAKAARAASKKEKANERNALKMAQKAAEAASAPIQLQLPEKSVADTKSALSSSATPNTEKPTATNPILAALANAAKVANHPPAAAGLTVNDKLNTNPLLANFMTSLATLATAAKKDGSGSALASTTPQAPKVASGTTPQPAASAPAPNVAAIAAFANYFKTINASLSSSPGGAMNVVNELRKIQADKLAKVAPATSPAPQKQNTVAPSNTGAAPAATPGPAPKPAATALATSLAAQLNPLATLIAKQAMEAQARARGSSSGTTTPVIGKDAAVAKTAQPETGAVSKALENFWGAVLPAIAAIQKQQDQSKQPPKPPPPAPSSAPVVTPSNPTSTTVSKDITIDDLVDTAALVDDDDFIDGLFDSIGQGNTGNNAKDSDFSRWSRVPIGTFRRSRRSSMNSIAKRDLAGAFRVSARLLAQPVHTAAHAAQADLADAPQ